MRVGMNNYLLLVGELPALHLCMYDSELQSSLFRCTDSSPNLCVSVLPLLVCVCVQEAAMVVPPLRRSRICWQSCRDRRSPTRSRVRLASASRRARCPGGVRRGMGRWRQASKMAWALSLSPRTHSPSDSSRGEEEKKKNMQISIHCLLVCVCASLCVYMCVKTGSCCPLGLSPVGFSILPLIVGIKNGRRGTGPEPAVKVNFHSALCVYDVCA